MPMLTIDDFNLYYEVHGTGTPIVFAHGVGGNHASWFNQIPIFAKGYQVIVYDHRGFGNSKDSQGGPGRSRFVEDLKDLMDYLAIEKAALVAQSMGGGTCTGFTVRYPQRVSALVLAGSVVGINLPETIALRHAEARKALEDLPQLGRSFGQMLRNDPVRSHLVALIASFNVDSDGSIVNRETLPGSFGMGATAAELAATGVPILFIVGSDDRVTPPDVVLGAHNLIPGSKYLEVPDSGHSAFFEYPEIFNKALLEFFAEVRIGRKEQGATARK